MSLTKKAISGTLWMSGISYIGFAVNFGIQLVLVRLLVPEDFGMFVLGLSIAEILFIFFSFSFSMAAIQIQDAEDLFDTAFYLSLISGFVIVLIGGILSLVLSSYYPKPSILVFFILCALQPIQGCSYIYSASMEKELQFKKNALVRGLSTNFSGFGAILLAYLGLGIWSLVSREIITVILMLFGMRMVSNYRFRREFNLKTAERIFDFAYKRMFVRGLEVSFFRIPLFLIGTFAGPKILGLFSQVYYLANLPNTMLGSANQTVAFATYSKIQNEKDKLSKGFYISNFFFVRIVLPIALLVYLFSSNILGILYGAKWLEASKIFKYSSIYIFLLPVFSNAVILTLSIGKLIDTIKIYAFCIISIFFGIIIALYSKNFWLFSLSYSLSLLIGLMIAIYLLKRERITIPVGKLFLVPGIILAVITILGECGFNKLFLHSEFSLFIIFIVAILFYIISIFSEYKESIKNFQYIKSQIVTKNER